MKNCSKSPFAKGAGGLMKEKMRQKTEFQNININNFKQKLLNWSQKFEFLAFFDSNGYYEKNTNQFSYNTFESIVAIGHISIIPNEKPHFETLKNYFNKTQDWLFGHLSYDLKNEIENLKSENSDEVLFSEIQFFQPKYVFIFTENKVVLEHFDEIDKDEFLNEILKTPAVGVITNSSELLVGDNTNKGIDLIKIQQKFQKSEYIESVLKIQNHIKRGDIYEMNFCQELFVENLEINPLETYAKLIEISPTPFSVFYKTENKYLISASPERFLKRIGTKIISQPIKGTIKRGENAEIDLQLRTQLECDEKERSENIMIVDLVRNDLSKTAKQASVKVEELCGIYSFKQVHQMISTISSEIDQETHFVDVIKSMFPMGSMTGAPKIEAMKLIEKFEKTKRGLYSGAVGYINPQGDFDFNVVIRSILYNFDKKYLSFSVGSAITAKSIAESEYDECLLKTEAIKKAILD